MKKIWAAEPMVCAKILGMYKEQPEISGRTPITRITEEGMQGITSRTQMGDAHSRP